MAYPLKRIQLLSQFECLGDKCPDTCCRFWSMQLDDTTYTKYQQKAPQLLDAVAQEPDGLQVMKRDPQTQECVKLEGGLCSIHRSQGADLLGDACYFYPRITRAVESEMIMGASLSCPEITRLALTQTNAFVLEQADVPRIPNQYKNYSLEELAPEQAITIHQFFLQKAAECPAEEMIIRTNSVARSLARLPQSEWPEAVEVFWELSAASLPQGLAKTEDPFNLLHALCGIAVATRKTINPRLKTLIQYMEQALHVQLDWENGSITLQADAAEAYGAVEAQWKNTQQFYERNLKSWLQGQLSAGFFPFAGLGNTMPERITFIGVRLATLKLMLMCAQFIKSSLSEEDIINAMYSLARLLDHLGDPELSLKIYTETGWIREERLRGLLVI